MAVDAGGKLYVTSADDSVDVFDTANNNIFLTKITGGGLSTPLDDALDASGKLYVANGFANSVSVFDTAHGNAPLTPITSGLINPQGVAVH